MSNSSQEPSWKAVVARKQAQRNSQLPSEWKIPSGSLPKDPPKPEDGPQNVLNVPRDFLTSRETEITESYTIQSLLSAISNKKLTATEVATSFCHRASIAQQLTNCITEPLFASAIARAKFLDSYLAENGQPFGPLHGLPVSVKDTFNVKGVDSSIGLVSLCFKPAGANAPLVDLLQSLGCVIIAKSNVPQTLASLDSINNVFGRTMNPINRLLTAGGSSGGEGVMVAMKACMIGFGTDIGGSIRIPAMCNGVYGFKPSVGVLPYGGQQGTGWEGLGRTSVQACAGPIARSINDIELVMKALAPKAKLFAEDCWSESSTWDSLPQQPSSNSSTPYRIGILTTDNNCTPLPPISNLLSELSQTLSSTPNIQIIHLTTPPALQKAQSLITRLMGADGATHMASLISSTSEPLVPWMSTRFKSGPPQSLQTLSGHQAARANLEREMLSLWSQTDSQGRKTRVLDAIICPVAPHPTPEIDRYNAVGYTSSWVLFDMPAGTIPIRPVLESDLQPGTEMSEKVLGSWDARNRELWKEDMTDRKVYLGSPLSVQVVVPKMEDAALVRAMRIVDEAVRGVMGGKAKL